MLKMLMVVTPVTMMMMMMMMIQITLLTIPNQIQSQPKQNLIQDRQAGGEVMLSSLSSSSSLLLDFIGRHTMYEVCYNKYLHIYVCAVIVYVIC